MALEIRLSSLTATQKSVVRRNLSLGFIQRFGERSYVLFGE